MGGDKIVLLDGAGANGGGAATNGLLSMIPAFPFFPKGNKKNKKYDTGRRAIEYPWPVCFYSIFF